MDNRSPLEAFLPTEPSQTEFLPWLEVKEVSGLARTNGSLNAFFKPALDQHAAKQLLIYVLQGNAEKAKAMYTANPGLLFIEATAVEWASGFEKETDDPTHRAVQMSPLSAMLAADDRCMLAEAMEILANYVDEETQQSGTRLAAEQMKQQFPNGFDYPLSTYDFSPLITVITNDQHLIQTGHPSDVTIALIEKFRKDFMPGIVRKGYLFNLNELVKALELYVQNFEPWDAKQRQFFWCQVIGYLERLVPAVFAQAICQGLTVPEGRPFQRSMSFKNRVSNKRTSYFPLDSDLACRLGLGFGVNSYYDRTRGESMAIVPCGLMVSGLISGALPSLSKLMSSNSNELGRIYAAIAAATNQPTPR